MVFLSRYAVRFLCPYQNFTSGANEDVTKDLNKINVPTKIFHGVHDQLIPYKSAELTQQRIKILSYMLLQIVVMVHQSIKRMN